MRTGCSSLSIPLERPAPSPADGFTLIELIVVIAILGVLATLVAPSIFHHVGTARSTTARSQIEMLGAALDAYRLDNSWYPTTAQGLEALRREPLSDPRPPNWNGPYLRKEVPTDPWGRPYIYRSPGQASGGGFDLLTYGRDGNPGGTGEDEDITSWQ